MPDSTFRYVVCGLMSLLALNSFLRLYLNHRRRKHWEQVARDAEQQRKAIEDGTYVG